jgi:TetR/AcrR family transcriptional regulator, transcriptional repressor of aconitase
VPKVSDEHKDNVRRRIMDAAVVCLVRNDYQEITTRELLAEAGLSTGTFYNYFPSKEDLYEALAEELLSEDVTRILGERADGDPGGHGLLHLLRDYMLADPRAGVAVANFRSRTTGEEAMAAVGRLNRWIVDEFTPLVEQAQTDGFVRPDIDPRALVELLDLVWHALGHRAAQNSFQTGYDQVGHVLMQILVGGALTGLPLDLDLSPRPTPPSPRAWPA